jgi:hypothetical protein
VTEGLKGNEIRIFVKYEKPELVSISQNVRIIINLSNRDMIELASNSLEKAYLSPVMAL